MRRDRPSAVSRGCDIDYGTIAGDLHFSSCIGQIINIGLQPRSDPSARQRKRPLPSAQRPIDGHGSVERLVDSKDVADPIQSDLRRHVEVVRTIRKRSDAPSKKDAQIRPTFERQRLEVEHVRGVPKLSPHGHPKRFVILNGHLQLRARRHALVKVLGRGAMHRRTEVRGYDG